MPITEQDIKLLASQRMTDTADLATGTVALREVSTGARAVPDDELRIAWRA